MTHDDERCKALAARQQKVYLAMRRLKKHCWDGQMVVFKFQPEPPSNVSTLRRRKT